MLTRTVMPTLAAGAVAACLAAATPVSAAAPRSTATVRAGDVFTCTYIDSKKLPDVYGRGCTPLKTGALSDFTIRPALLGSSYHCQTGWADGLEVVNGANCQETSG